MRIQWQQKINGEWATGVSENRPVDSAAAAELLTHLHFGRICGFIREIAICESSDS